MLLIVITFIMVGLYQMAWSFIICLTGSISSARDYLLCWFKKLNQTSPANHFKQRRILVSSCSTVLSKTLSLCYVSGSVSHSGILVLKHKTKMKQNQTCSISGTERTRHKILPASCACVTCSL